MLATVTHANHRVLVASLGLPVPYPAHIPLPPLHVHATPEITYRHVLPTQPPLSCVAQTPIPCSARAAQDTHSYFSCVRILEGMTGVSFVSLTGRQRLLLLCMGGRVSYFLNTMFACNETWQRQQRPHVRNLFVHSKRTAREHVLYCLRHATFSQPLSHPLPLPCMCLAAITDVFNSESVIGRFEEISADEY